MRRYYAHRLAFLYMTGKFPTYHTDHIDHDGSNNKWDNLREVTRSKNMKNQIISSANASGFTGVYWCNKDKRWIAKVKIDGKNIVGGYFKNKEDAIKKRKEMNIEYGFHENHGKEIVKKNSKKITKVKNEKIKK